MLSIYAPKGGFMNKDNHKFIVFFAVLLVVAGVFFFYQANLSRHFSQPDLPSFLPSAQTPAQETALIPTFLPSAQTTAQETALIPTTGEPYHIFIPTVTVPQIQGIFVSTSGSDSNPGTLIYPLRTISKAARMAVAGDTVYIRGGIYNESVIIPNSGTETKLIRVMAYPGETPVIDGGGTIPGEGGSLVSLNGNYIYVSGLEVRNSGYVGIYLSGTHNVVDNVFVHHSNQNGILINGDYGTVENSRVWRNSLSNEYALGNGYSSGLSAARDTTDGITDYAVMRGNEVWENWGEGISSFEANQILIENNIVHDNSNSDIYISDSTNVVCQGNFVYANPASYTYGYQSQQGIMLGDERYSPPSANIKIINNISFGHKGNFFWFQGLQGGGMNNVLIANNTFANSIGDATVSIANGTHQNVRFQNNLVLQDGTAAVISVDANAGVSFSANLWSKKPPAAASGVGDIVGDPKLAKTGSLYTPEWFKLTDLSPAIHKAIVIPDVVVDYFGNSRGIPPDTGAIEYSP